MSESLAYFQKQPCLYDGDLCHELATFLITFPACLCSAERVWAICDSHQDFYRQIGYWCANCSKELPVMFCQILPRDWAAFDN